MPDATTPRPAATGESVDPLNQAVVSAHVYAASTYLALPRHPETWLIRPLVPVGGAAVIIGDAKVGKSFAAIQLACALTGNLPDWLGFHIPAPGPVLYVQLDTPRSLWMTRLDEVQDAGFPLDHIYFSDRESLDAWPFDISRPDHFARLRACVTLTGAHTVIIDTLREAHSGEENDATPMQAIVARLVAATHPAALIVIAHTRKAQLEAGPNLINDMRGSNYVVGRMDAIIRFTRKHCIYTGRACEEGSIKLARLDCGLWAPEPDELETHIKAVLADPSLTSLRARSRALSTRTGKGEEACRARLRRWVEGGGPPQGVGHMNVPPLSHPTEIA